MENKTPWQIYKEKFMADNTVNEPEPEEFLDDESAAARFEICKACPLFNFELGICEDCGCFMENKTKLKAAECPIHKW